MQRLEVSGAVRYIYIYIYIIRQLKVNTVAVVYRGIFSRGVQQIHLMTEVRENGDLGGGSPLVRGSAQFANG
jgi:hypothetical protein